MIKPGGGDKTLKWVHMLHARFQAMIIPLQYRGKNIQGKDSYNIGSKL